MVAAKANLCASLFKPTNSAVTFRASTMSDARHKKRCLFKQVLEGMIVHQGMRFRIIRTLLGYVSFVVCRCLLWVPGSKLYGPCKCSDHVRHVELVVQHGQFNVSHSTVTVDSHVRNTKPAVTACSVPLGIQFLGRLPCLNWLAVQTVCRQLG